MEAVFISILCSSLAVVALPAGEMVEPDATLRYSFDPAHLQPPTAETSVDDDARDLPTDSPTAEPFGMARTYRWAVRGGYGFDLRDSRNRVGQVGLGLSYFIVDDLSLEVEVNAMHVDQTGENAVGLNANLLFRWHFWARENYTLYVDAGAGLLGVTERVPINGSRFNFTPQIGAGFTIDVGSNVRVVSGVRWHHISNSNLFRDNPGRDSVMLYTGLSFPF